MKKEHVFLGTSLLTTLAAVWMLWPFMDAILWGVFTAYFLLHVERRLNQYVQNRAVTSTIVILVLIGFVSGLLYTVLTSIPQIIDFMQRFSTILSSSISIIIDVFDLPPAFASATQSIITQFTEQGRSIMMGMVRQIPTLLINLLVYFMVAVFLVKDGYRVRDTILDTVRQLPEDYRDIAVALISSLDELFRGVFLTYLVVALVVGTLAAAGFMVIGVDMAIGWGVIMGIFAFFPVVSGPMVYGPLTLLYITLGQFWKGVAVLMYGVIVLNTLPEVLLRPYLAAHHTHEHPLILFTGFILGPLTLGFKGIILGPIILVVAKNMLMMKYFSPADT